MVAMKFFNAVGLMFVANALGQIVFSKKNNNVLREDKSLVSTVWIAIIFSVINIFLMLWNA